jgi:hypothetical protein
LGTCAARARTRLEHKAAQLYAAPDVEPRREIRRLYHFSVRFHAGELGPLERRTPWTTTPCYFCFEAVTSACRTESSGASGHTRRSDFQCWPERSLALSNATVTFPIHGNRIRRVAPSSREACLSVWNLSGTFIGPNDITLTTLISWQKSASADSFQLSPLQDITFAGIFICRVTLTAGESSSCASPAMLPIRSA